MSRLHRQAPVPQEAGKPTRSACGRTCLACLPCVCLCFLPDIKLQPCDACRFLPSACRHCGFAWLSGVRNQPLRCAICGAQSAACSSCSGPFGPSESTGRARPLEGRACRPAIVARCRWAWLAFDNHRAGTRVCAGRNPCSAWVLALRRCELFRKRVLRPLFFSLLSCGQVTAPVPSHVVQVTVGPLMGPPRILSSPLQVGPHALYPALFTSNASALAVAVLADACVSSLCVTVPRDSRADPAYRAKQRRATWSCLSATTCPATLVGVATLAPCCWPSSAASEAWMWARGLQLSRWLHCA
jgi:hypothetical protein